MLARVIQKVRIHLVKSWTNKRPIHEALGISFSHALLRGSFMDRWVLYIKNDESHLTCESEANMRLLSPIERYFKEICPGYKTPEEINMEYIRPKGGYLTDTFPINEHLADPLDDGDGGTVFAVDRGKGAFELTSRPPLLKRPTRNKVKTKAQKQARKHNRK